MTTPSESHLPRLFVGRDREMRDLLAGLDDACASRGRIMLLVGEAGIGKTRTAEELGVHARRRAAHVFVGRCYEGEGAPPYWPWVEVVRAYARASDPAMLLTDMGRGAADIAWVIDELRHRLPDLPAQPSVGAEQARFRFFDSLTRFLTNAARRQPLVLILDDLHRADQPSLLFLQFLAREIADAPLLLIGTYRDDEINRRHPLVDALGELARQPVSRVVALTGLSEIDVGRFMEGVGGGPPPPAMVAAVHQRTEGNPFFVGQLVRLLAPDGTWTQGADAPASAIPRGVQDVLAARLGRLSPACRGLLQLAAVAGREFDLRIVAAAAHALESRQAMSRPLPDVESYLAPLEEAVRQRMIAAIPGTVFEYSFSHALIRDALYEALGHGQRMAWHRAIGEALEAAQPSASVARLAELAHHFFETIPGGGDAGKAVRYARRAADHAKSRLAYEEAVRCCELALRALSHQPPDERQECDLMLALGEARHLASDETAAREAFQRAGDLARRLGEPELLARAALGFAGVVIGVEVDRRVIAVLEEALAALGDGAGALRATLLSRLAMELYLSPDAERRAEVSNEAVSTARASGDRRALTRALEALHFAVWQRIGPTARLAIADEMIRLSEEIDDAETLMRGHHLRLTDLLELGRIEEVDAAIAAYGRLAEELRPPSHRWGLGLCLAMRAVMHGRFAEAEQLAAAALTVGQSVQPETAANFFAAQMFFVRREQGRLAELEDALVGAVAAYPSVPGWHAVLASLYAEIGRRPEAEREFEHAASGGFRDVSEDSNWLAAIAFLGEVCAFLGDQRRAAHLYDLLLPHAELVAVIGIASACNGSVARVLGLLAATLGRWDAAAGHFEQALAVNRQLGARPFVARTLQEYAAMVLAASDAGVSAGHDAARRTHTMLSEALEIARVLGMDGVAAKSSALLVAPSAPAGPDSGEDTRQPERVSAGTAGPTRALDPGDNVFRKEADYWIVAYEGATCRLKDAKGLRYIATLLGEPNRPFHVSELLRPEVPAATGEVGDYRERLRDLSADLEEAERFNDRGRAAQVKTEIDTLTRELTDRMGLERDDVSHELLRLRVTKAIKAAARRISTRHPALGHHLQTTIRTGSVCTYAPDPTKPIGWKVA